MNKYYRKNIQKIPYLDYINVSFRMKLIIKLNINE